MRINSGEMTEERHDNEPLIATGASGYAHPGYARSLAEFGAPHQLPRSGGWILERKIPGSTYRDAMGLYPLLVCPRWSHLRSDLEELEDRLVCVSAVIDPFADLHLSCLHQCFPDLLIRFKEHYVVDLRLPITDIVSSHHRYYALKALKTVEVQQCPRPIDFLDDWVSVYESLTDKHRLTGLKAFSKASFRQQLTIPGMVMFRATHEGVLAGAELWLVDRQVGYSHLAAFSPTGYATRTAYALKWVALNYFAANLRWLDLGGGAGVAGDAAKSEGLSSFKRGWATGVRPAYFGGRICNRGAYEQLSAGTSPDAYFPPYRSEELC